MLRVGETVGPYEILARLKSGGMATLFVGQKRGASGFSRHVAIKVVHEHLASDDEFVRMFVDEAKLQARIHHPNVVHVEELGETPTPDGGAPAHYLVMEYVWGCSLAQLLDALAKRDRRLSPEIAVHIAIQTLAGLHAAHELKDDQRVNLGVVHRDVSPQNVLLAYEGHVKLIDFGVAKARNRSQQTTGASIKGKIRYMPPEQAIGTSAIDRRADVYALGIVLWEMLAFRKLFGAKDDLALLDMVRNPKIVPPSTVSREVPPELDRVVMKALAPRVDDRFATAQEFRRALAEAMPKAMLIDASHVADLLLVVMGDQMQKEREALPSQLSAVVANDVRRANADTSQNDEALHTMTISAAGLAYLQDLPIEVDVPVQAEPKTAPVQAPAAAQELAPSPATVVVPSEMPPPRPQPLADTWRGDPALPTPTRPAEAVSSRMPMVLGMVAVVLVAIAAGAWFMLAGQSQPIARSLSPTEPTHAAAPASEVVGVAPATSVPTTPTPPPALPTIPIAVPPPSTAVAAPRRTAIIPEVHVASPRPPPSTTVHAPPASSTHDAPTRDHPRPRRAPATTATSAVPLADEW